ncbi:hypothetical protein NM688_g5548 [Phlebia brevispora]|uniref:Uncharacterized protein n=1 Tax=Phlebia brevispora TaxID=194682 RepID=A0ACC1STY4_9APHY|nr:hypothetical protein NM688_g5548 [Phlebia brevispora]
MGVPRRPHSGADNAQACWWKAAMPLKHVDIQYAEESRRMRCSDRWAVKRLPVRGSQSFSHMHFSVPRVVCIRWVLAFSKQATQSSWIAGKTVWSSAPLQSSASLERYDSVSPVRVREGGRTGPEARAEIFREPWSGAVTSITRACPAVDFLHIRHPISHKHRSEGEIRVRFCVLRTSTCTIASSRFSSASSWIFAFQADRTSKRQHRIWRQSIRWRRYGSHIAVHHVFDMDFEFQDDISQSRALAVVIKRQA